MIFLYAHCFCGITVVYFFQNKIGLLIYKCFNETNKNRRNIYIDIQRRGRSLFCKNDIPISREMQESGLSGQALCVV